MKSQNGKNGSKFITGNYHINTMKIISNKNVHACMKLSLFDNFVILQEEAIFDL